MAFNKRYPFAVKKGAGFSGALFIAVIYFICLVRYHLENWSMYCLASSSP